MFNQTETQRTRVNSFVDDYLLTWVEAFLIDRKAQGVSSGTIRFYQSKLKLFLRYCESQVITKINQITPTHLREFLLQLADSGHNPGGCHAVYRTIRAFLYWYEDEAEPPDWKNPILKVKAPKVPVEPLEPVSFSIVEQMLKHCESGTFTGDRDAAILLCLLDTGTRASELLSINLEDINQVRGDILIRRGKGGKPRTVYLGKKTRKAVKRYLRHRIDDSLALWVTHPRYGSERLTYDGLRAVITRRAKLACIEAPTLHDFRRAFCLSMLRQGTDIFTLAKLMGHESIAVLQRYLKQTNQDTEQAHRRAGPVDNAGF